MGDPAERHRFLVEQLAGHCVKHTEITVQFLLLHPSVDVVTGAFVQSVAFSVGVIVEYSAVGHRHAEALSVVAHVSECRHPAVFHGVQYVYDAVESHFADAVILNEIDGVALAVETDACLAKALSGVTVEVYITLQYAVAVLRELLLAAVFQISDIYVGAAVAVADEVDTPVVGTQRRTGEIKQLGVEARRFVRASADKDSFFHVDGLWGLLALMNRCLPNWSGRISTWRKPHDESRLATSPASNGLSSK